MSEGSDEFVEYEKRFETNVGRIQPGQFGQFRGRLVKRLNRSEYSAHLCEYESLGQQLMDALENGQTLSENLTSQIRSLEFTIVLEKSRFLP